MGNNNQIEVYSWENVQGLARKISKLNVIFMDFRANHV